MDSIERLFDDLVSAAVAARRHHAQQQPREMHDQLTRVAHLLDRVPAALTAEAIGRPSRPGEAA